MTTALIPFLTIFTPTPDMSYSDLESEIIRLNQRNLAIEALLQGTLDSDVVLDLLAEDGIEPDEWIDVSLENCGING